MRAMFRACLIGSALLISACASSAPRTPKATAAASTVKSAQPSSSGGYTVNQGPPREGASGSTLKTVSCGKQRCKAGAEVCTDSGKAVEPWACMPKDASALGDSLYACDDPSDCSPPSTCCLRWASGSERFECGKPDLNCKALPCSLAEGTPCPQGQYCKDGFCGVDARATCGVEKLCSADKPYCVWSDAPECASQTGALAAEGELVGGGRVTGVYECTKPSDCGTQKCCTSTSHGVAQTFCMNSCDSGLTMTVCDTAADCTRFTHESCGQDAACRKKVHCDPLRPGPDTTKAPLPPWLKLCLMADE
jgi:hypothetical protein